MAYDLLSRVLDGEKEEAPLVNQTSSYSLFERMNGGAAPAGPTQPATPSNWFSEGTSSFGRGIDELQQMGYGAGALATSWMGWDGAREAFMRGYNVNQKQIDENPESVPTLSDIPGDSVGKTLDNAVRYGISSVAGFVPMALQGVATGVIGAALGTAAEPGGGTVGGGIAGIVAKKAVKNLLASEVKNVISEGVEKEIGEYVAGKVSRDALSAEAKSLLTKPLLDTAKAMGSTAAVGMANVGIMQGALYGELEKDPNIPESDKRWAATAGGFLAALPMTSVANSIGKTFMPGATDAFIKSAVGQKAVAEEGGYAARFLTVGGKEMLKNFGHMGAAMFTQTAINIAAKKWADPDTRWDFLNYTPQDWQSMIDATVKGGIGGAFVGGSLATFGHMVNHPNPEVRTDMRDILQKADDSKVGNAEETPESIELDKVHGHIGMLEAAINSGKLSPEELASHQQELEGHKKNEEDLLGKLGFQHPDAPLVNESGAPSEPAKEEPAKPNEVPQGANHDEKLVESLRAFYGDKMPSGGSPTEQLPDIEGKAKDRQAEIDAHVQSIAAGSEYGAKLKEALTPDIVRMMAAENVHLATDETEKNHYAANLDNNGKIHLFVPKADFVEKEAQSRASVMGGDPEQAKQDVLNTVRTAVVHEVAHVADLVNIRDQHSKLPEEGRESLVNYKTRVWKERGARFREAFPDLPKLVKASYHWGKIGILSDEQLGAELPRMAMEIARTGKTTEVTESLQDAARNNGKLNAHLRDWINALKTIGARIKSFIDPKTGNPELLKAYHDIQTTLDKYGVLVNQTEAPKVETAPPEVKAAAPEVKPGEPHPLQHRFDEIKAGNLTKDGQPSQFRETVSKAMQAGIINSPEDLHVWNDPEATGHQEMHDRFAKSQRETVSPNMVEAFRKLVTGDVSENPSFTVRTARVAYENGIIKTPKDLQDWDDKMANPRRVEMAKEFAALHLAGVEPEWPKKEAKPAHAPEAKPREPAILPAQEASLVNEKTPNKFQQFRKSIKTGGPSDVVRAYLDWQDGKGQMPKTAAEIRLAHQDYMNRAEKAGVTLDRFKELVKEKKAEQNAKILEGRKSTKPAKKASYSDVESEPTGHDELLHGEPEREGRYHTGIAAELEEKAKQAPARSRVAAIQNHIAEHKPYLVNHVRDIVNQIRTGVSDLIASRWMKEPMPLRGEETARNIRDYKYAMTVGDAVTEASRKLGEERGIVVLGPGEEVPEGHYVMDTNPDGQEDPMVDPSSSIHLPVQVTNKLEEARLSNQIPETHPVHAFGEGPIDDAMIASFDDHFGQNNWILKNFGDDALQSKGVAFAQSVKFVKENYPEHLANADTSEMMVQELHDISVNQQDREANIHVRPGEQLRVHVLTDQNGQAHILPFSTFWKLSIEEGERTPGDQRVPIMVENGDIQSAHSLALDAISSLPESDRSGQFYGLDVIRKTDGSWGVVELNPSDKNGASGYFLTNPLAHDAYMAAMMGERPVHAEIASVVHDAMREDGISPRLEAVRRRQSYWKTESAETETPIVNENEAAQKPSLSKTAQDKVDRMWNEINNAFGKTVSELEEAKVETKEGGNRGEYSHMIAAGTEYESEPKTQAVRRAQSIMEERGAEEVMQTLMQDPSAMRFPLSAADEIDGTLGAGLTSLYDIALQSINAGVARLETEPGGPMRTYRNYLKKVFSQLESQKRMLGRAAGRASSASHEVDMQWNAAQGRRAYVEPILAHLEKVLGKKGARFIGIMTDHLNELMANVAGRAVEKSPVLAELVRIAKMAHTRDFQNEARKTAFSTEAKARSYVRNMAARAGTYTGMQDMGKDQLDLVAKGIIRNISGLVKTGDAKNETQIFQMAVHQVARDNADSLGMLNESKPNNVTVEQKFAAIMKNPGLYSQFTDALHSGIMSEYKPEPGSPFAEKVAELHNYMLDRQWSEGMVDTLVNKNMKAFETTFSKIAKDHYGATEFHSDAMRAAVHDAMMEHGVDNPDLVNKLMDDVEGDFKSRTEQARLEFLGSATGVREFLRHMQTTLAEKAKEHALAKTEVPEQLRHWLAEDFGLPDTAEMPIASSLEDVMTRQYNQMLAEERPKLIERMLKQASDGQSDTVKKKAMQSVDKVVQLVNLGLFRNEDAYNALAGKFGLPAFDKDVAARAEVLGAKLATAENSRMKEDYKQELSVLVGSQKGISPYDMFMSGLYVNMLSGPSTLGVHNSSLIASIGGHMLVNAVQYRRTIPEQMRAAFISMTGPALTEAKEVFTTGVNFSRFGDKYFGERNPLEMENPIFKSDISRQLDFGTRGEPLGARIESMAERGATLLHRLYRILGAKYVGRILSAADAFYYKLAQDVSFAAKTGIVENEEMRRSAMDQARQQMLDQGENPDDSRALKLKQNIYANRIVNEMRLVNQSGPNKGEMIESARLAWVESHNEAMDITFKQDPKGLLGRFSKAIEAWAQGEKGVNGEGNVPNPIGKMLIPFTRIAANVTNQMLDWTPYGLVRWGAGHLYGEDFRLRDEDGKVTGRDPKVAIRSILGMTGMMGLAMMMTPRRDEHDPYFALFDEGPKNPQARKELMDRGWRPKTFKVGGSYISYSTTPFAMAFAVMGRMFDNARDGKQDENGLASSAVAMLQSVTHESFLSSLTDFMSAVDSPNPESKMANMMARMASTPFVPNLVKQIDKWVDPSIQEAQGFSENFIRNLPVVRHELNPALNYFGHELKHQPGVDLPGTERFLTMEKTDDPVLNLGSEKGIIFPGFSKSTRLGNVPMTRDQYYQYVKTAGPRIEAEIKANIPQIRALDREHAQERVNEIVRKVKEKVRDEMRDGLVN